MRSILSYPPAGAGLEPSAKLPACRAFRVHGLGSARLLAKLTDAGGALLGELLVADGGWIDLGDAGTGLWWLEGLPGESRPATVGVTYVPPSSSLEAGWIVPGAAPLPTATEDSAAYVVPAGGRDFNLAPLALELVAPAAGARRFVAYYTAPAGVRLTVVLLAAAGAVAYQAAVSAALTADKVSQPVIGCGTAAGLPGGAIVAAAYPWIPETLRVTFDTAAAGTVIAEGKQFGLWGHWEV